MQVLPSKELSPYIKHYLFLDNKETTIQKLRLFSDGNMGVVFSLKSKLISDITIHGIKNYLPGSFLYGQLNSFKDIYSDNEIALVIVVFQPYGINKLLQIPANEFHDSIINTDAIFGEKCISLEERLSEQNNNDEKIKLLNQFFKTVISKKSESNQLIINSSLDFILANKGYFSVKQLVDHSGYTERHLERKFKECIGLNPKKFGNVIRLHHFLKLLKHRTKDLNLTAICYDAGFSDQSHLIKEFKKQTGITPTEYLYNTGKLANNLLKALPSITI